MADNPKVPDTGDVPKGDAATSTTPATKKVKKEWKNPALRMMGIPKFGLPSRNWMIFWTVLAGIGGGIAYDKYQQSQIRKKYMKLVEHLGEEVYSQQRIPRKLTIFIAPPPNDFLEESLRYFRKYVKPILNSAAIDYEIYTENRQGDIRSQVAEKIRQLRRSQNEKQAETKSENDEFKHRHDLYEAKDVLGLYQLVNPFTPVRDDEVNVENAGGVLCIGRGTYKEYMTGVHEGLLGPLEQPVIETEPKSGDIDSKVAENEPKSTEVDQKVAEIEPKNAEIDQKVAEIEPQTPESGSTEVKSLDAKLEENKEKEEATDDDEEKLPPVPKPYITADQYTNSQLAPELNFGQGPILNDNKVPVLFEQPVYVYPVPNLLGFFNTPQKIYRYFTKRTVAEDYGKRTLSIIYNLNRSFEYKDKFAGKEEELDWPKKWIEKGKENGSEWVQELELDDRVTTRMRIYDEKLISNHPEILVAKNEPVNSE